jgi:hypothetical protein
MWGAGQGRLQEQQQLQHVTSSSRTAQQATQENIKLSIKTSAGIKGSLSAGEKVNLLATQRFAQWGFARLRICSAGPFLTSQARSNSVDVSQLSDCECWLQQVNAGVLVRLPSSLALSPGESMQLSHKQKPP